MTNWVTIPDGDIDPGSPGTQALFTALRDNPAAIAEGASGAPRIARGAFANTTLLKSIYDYGDGSDGAQAWTTAGSAYAPGLWQCTTFSIAAGQTATLSKRGTLHIMAQTSITISGTLNHDGGGGEGSRMGDNYTIYGTPGGAGMYGGSGGAGADSGGGFGGNGGGVAFVDGGKGTATNGTDGSSQSSREQATLKLLTGGVIASSGSQDGQNNNGGGEQGAASTGGGGGGGPYSAGAFSYRAGDGGGLIILSAPEITIASGAFIYSRGTAGGTWSGGGGGGCVILACPVAGYTNSGTVTVTGGAGGTTGANGGDGGAGWWDTVDLT